MRRGLFFGLLAVAALAAPSPARAAACPFSARASAHSESFEAAGYDSSPARLSRLAALTRDRFAAAARRLCEKGVLRPGDLRRYRRMVVQNGEGATEPVIYEDGLMGPGFFIFQFAFQNGGPPEPKAFEQAIRCWKRPQSPGCDLGD